MNTVEPKYDIAIILPVFNEALYIGHALEQLYMQDYPMDRVEVVVADGNSTDRTREIAASFKGRFGSLKVLDNAGQRPPSGRNVGIRNSSARYVMILDGHTHLPHRNLLSSIVELFGKYEADCLCRPQPLNPPDISEFQTAVALCRESLLGHKPGSEIYADFEGEVDPTSSGAMYRREVFDTVGYFDETFDACEDVDFNHRVKKAGLKAVLSPRLKVFYYPRATLGGLWRQMRRYGLGRARFAFKHNIFAPVQWLAGAGVLAFAMLLLLSLVSSPVASVFRSLTGLYLLSVVFFSLFLAYSKKAPACLLYGPLIFPTIHFGLGSGFLTGLYERLQKSRMLPPSPRAGKRAGSETLPTL